jgi:hypothetical protein
MKTAASLLLGLYNELRAMVEVNTEAFIKSLLNDKPINLDDNEIEMLTN